MEYSSGNYIVKVFNDSTDNMQNYDFEYLNDTEYVFPSIHGIIVERGDIESKSAVIGAPGGETDIHKNSVIFEKDRLVICCSDSIFCLSIPALRLLWQTKADQATCFGIFKYKNSYIVHGEFEISRLDFNGKILWQQGGMDIFTAIDGEEDFVINEEYIFARDFEGKEYKFSFNGEILK